MSKGVVIHLDNDLEGILTPSKDLFDQMELGLDYITCSSKDEFESHLKNTQLPVKSLIFDLMDTSSSDPVFLEKIETAFLRYNVPVFIYSGFLESINDRFDNNATVYKFDKAKADVAAVFDKIKFFSESGFLDVFCQGGILDNELSFDLNKAFINQFVSNEEMERIITQIKGEKSFDETNERIKKVFKRISIRTLLSELLSPDLDGEGNIIEETVNPVEHYIRRINSIPVWTGDIFKKKNSDNYIFILTPRCNVIRNDQILICPFLWKDIISKNDKVSKMLQGDPTVSGYDRHIPPSPIFEGGKLALSKYYMIEKNELLNNYARVISLSDELTNEIIGKFGAHFFRTGITPWDVNEVKEQIATKK